MPRLLLGIQRLAHTAPRLFLHAANWRASQPQGSGMLGSPAEQAKTVKVLLEVLDGFHPDVVRAQTAKWLQVTDDFVDLHKTQIFPLSMLLGVPPDTSSLSYSCAADGSISETDGPAAYLSGQLLLLLQHANLLYEAGDVEGLLTLTSKGTPADCFSPINRALGGIICVLKALLVLYSANTKAASASAATSVLLEVLNLLKARLPDRHVAILLPISRPFSINTGLVTAVVRHTMPLLRLHIKLSAHPADIFLDMLLHVQWLAPFHFIAEKELVQKGEHTLYSSKWCA